jgi:tetratricopeptide (TPR) repeat protein
MAGMGGMPMGGMGMGGMGMMGMPMGGMGMGGMGMGGMPGGQFTGGSFQGSFNGSLGFQGATQAVGLIDIITRIVDPGNWNKPPTLQPFAMAGFPPFAGMGGAFGMVGMVGMAGMGMVGAGPPQDPTVVPPDPQTANSIDFFPPALALIIRAPSRIHSSFEGGIVGGKAKRVEGAWLGELEKKQFAKNNEGGGKVNVGGVQDKDNAERLAALAKREQNLDPKKVWQDAFAKGGASTGMVIATADFLFEAGEFKHAAEFLKANLRYGVVVRPWVFEALAVALEASGGDKDEIRRVRLSGIALDPNDAQGFMSAARAMADRGEHARAIAFCRQAALLEPNDYHPYETALAYAESAKDARAMEWAVGKLVSQDWPVDNLAIQLTARKRLDSLASTLKKENRGSEAATLQSAVQRLNQRDLVVRLIWDNASPTNPSELEMKIKEPSGSICNLEQKQTPGGGIMIGYNLTDKEPNSQYVVAQAFAGTYEITISRVYGQVLGNRARLEIITNAGTDQQTRRLEVIRLDQTAMIKVTLKDGRRTELATVSPAATVRHTQASVQTAGNAFNDLRAVANPAYYGNAGGPRGGSSSNMPNVPSVASLAAKDSKNKAPTTLVQNSINPGNGGVQMTAQLRVSADQRSMDMVIRPFFQSVNAARSGVNFSAIPGGSD